MRNTVSIFNFNLLHNEDRFVGKKVGALAYFIHARQGKGIFSKYSHQQMLPNIIGLSDEKILCVAEKKKKRNRGKKN